MKTLQDEISSARREETFVAAECRWNIFDTDEIDKQGIAQSEHVIKRKFRKTSPLAIPALPLVCDPILLVLALLYVRKPQLWHRRACG